MQVFVAFNISHPAAVEGRIEEQYAAGNFYKASSNSFFIATDGETTRQVGEKLGFGEENLASGIVLPVTSYWGRYGKDLWEWISVKMDANGK